MKLTILLLLVAGQVFGATIYVRTDGNNSNSGASNDPAHAKLTIAGALSAISGGDTIAINDGTYSERNGISTGKNGSLGTPTIIKAVNPLMVTNVGGFTVSQGGAGYIEFRDIVFQDGASNPAWEGIVHFYHNNSGAALGAGYVVTNCWFVGTQDPTTHNIIGLAMDVATNPPACAANFKLLSCVFTNNSQYSLSVMVSNGVIANNRFDFANTHDAIHCWGNYITISNNVFTNISANPLVSDHTDILQYWNDNTTPSVCSNVFFCNNHIINCDAQMFELQQDGNCSFNFTNAGAANVGKLYVFNNIYENVDRPGFVSIPDCHFYNNLWYRCRQYTGGGGNMTLLFGGASNSCGIAYGTTITNCAFIDCGNSNYVNDAHAGWYSDGNTGGLTNFQADYNFVCGTSASNYPAKTAGEWGLGSTQNVHSVNGGNPYLRAVGLGDYHLNKNSPLIGAGIPTPLFTDDYEGGTRGASWDIGPYLFDSTLQVFINPAQDFSGGIMSDLTGYGHDGIRFSATNWPVATNSDGKASALFTVVPGNVLSPPTDSGWGQFVGVTNLTSINHLINGTLSVWARYFQTKAGGTNWDEADTQRLFDGGYQGMPWSAGTFFMGRGFDPVSGDVMHTVVRLYTTNVLNNPTTIFAFPDGSQSTGGDTLAWHMYTITWSGSNVLGYFDATNCATTNNMTGFLNITNDFNWFGLGCWTHNGTPQWDGDGYPNNGWLNGTMGPVSIYTRTLASNEVASLFAGGGASFSGGGSNPPAIHGTFSAGTIRAGRVSKP